MRIEKNLKNQLQIIGDIKQELGWDNSLIQKSI